MEILTWFFSSPTPTIAVISAVIAFLAYSHQRNLKKKDTALHLADIYSTQFIPRSRYINSILTSIGAKKYIDAFPDPSEFTEKELADFLSKKSGSIDKFKKLFSKCTKDHLEKAYADSGCNEFISIIHKDFLEVEKNSPKLLGDAVYKFILDFLNDLEAMSAKFYYNIAEEELVYPILHQTYLSHMKNWYFFIAHKNSLDHDRFYPHIIWLYDEWYERKNSKRDNLKERIQKGYRKNKLH